jgi:hypothetical protein
MSAPAWIGLVVAIGETAAHLTDIALGVAERHGGDRGREAASGARARAEARRAAALARARAERGEG